MDKMNKWMKLAVDFCDDEKIKIIRNHEGGDTFIWIWLWLLTTAMKKETDTLYVVAGIPYDAAMISMQADVKLDAVTKAIELFQKLKMIEFMEDGGLVITNFMSHQSIANMQHKRQMATERKRKQRAKIEYNYDVTRDECDSHATEESRVEESRIENKDTPQQQEKEARKIHRDTFANVWKSEHDKRYDNKYIFEKADWVQYNRYKLYDIDTNKLKNMVIAWLDADPQYQRPYIKNFACRLTVAETLVAKGAKQVFQQSGPF